MLKCVQRFCFSQTFNEVAILVIVTDYMVIFVDAIPHFKNSVHNNNLIFLSMCNLISTTTLLLKQ